MKPANIQTQQIRGPGKLMFDQLNMYYDSFEEIMVNFARAGLIADSANLDSKNSPLDIRNFHTDGLATLSTPAEILIGFFRYYG